MPIAVNKKNYQTYKKLKPIMAFKYDDAEWRCETKCGKYLYVRYSKGVLAMSSADTEHDIGNDVHIVASDDSLDKENPKSHNFLESELGKALLSAKSSDKKLKSIIEKIPDSKKTFDEIKEFMGWKIKDDMIWDS